MADEYIKRILAKAEFTGNFRDEYPTALIHALIDSVPAADVAPVRHGRWMPEDECKVAFHSKCSECGCFVSNFPEDAFLDCSQAWNYCPNCGAKMDGGET